ncbi:MAG TPA: hypothetical protein VGE55_05760 [Limnobacter sp.]|uniref:hypothetical protein n=1 Tax=Limnobacter sp. TaxID=2003368 RepID=UPI002ED9652D
MKTHYMAVVLALGLFGCSGAPGDSDVQTALQTTLRTQVQEQMNVMSALGGKSASEAAQSMLGMPKPEDIHIEDMDVSDAQKQENGDYVVKANFTTKVGEKKEKSAAKLTLSKVNGQWKISGMEKL